PAPRAASGGGGQDRVEMAHHFADRAVAQQRHPDDEPHDVLRGQLASADRRGARCLQRLRDPRRVQRLAEELKAWRAVARAHRQDGLPQLHHPTSVGETNYTLWMKGSRIRSLTRSVTGIAINGIFALRAYQPFAWRVYPPAAAP